MDALTGPFGAGLGPLGQTLIVPTVAAAVVALLVRAAGGRGQVGLAAGLGVGAAMLAMAWALGGAPRLARPAGVDKLVILTIALPVLIAVLTRRGWVEPRTLLPIAGLAPVVWIAWPLLMGLDGASLLKVAAALAAGGVVIVGIARTEGAAMPAALPVAAAGLAVVGGVGVGLQMGQLLAGGAVGLVAAPAAAVASRGGRPAVAYGAVVLSLPFRAAATAGIAGAAAILLLFTQGMTVAVALLGPALFASDLARGLPGGATAGPLRHGAMSMGVALLSVAAAVGFVVLEAVKAAG